MRTLLNFKQAVLVRVDRFGREYLSTPADRRRVWENLVDGALTVLLVIVTGVVLWGL